MCTVESPCGAHSKDERVKRWKKRAEELRVKRDQCVERDDWEFFDDYYRAMKMRAES